MKSDFEVAGEPHIILKNSLYIWNFVWCLYWNFIPGMECLIKNTLAWIITIL